MGLHPFSLLQYLLPQHAISRLVHRVARAQKIPGLRPTMRWFVRRYGVRMDEAAEPNLDAYPHFNSFFTRALRPGVRPLPDDPLQPCCPVDGYVSQVGKIRNGRLFQAKGQLFSLQELLGGSEERAAPFQDGDFATLYLSPGDYHRIHMPLAGQLQEMIHVPGRLFSVAPICVRDIPRLFARNERVACLFETDLGPMAVVLVGAINVGSIETVWAGEVTPPRGRQIVATRYAQTGAQAVSLERGAELGRFNLGSTVIILFGAGRVRWSKALREEAPVRLGQSLAERLDAAGSKTKSGAR